MRRTTWMALACLLTPFSVLVGASQQAADLVGVVGKWTTTADGALTVDGAAWSGKTDAADLRRVGTEVFGATSEGLVRNATAAGAFPFAVVPTAKQFSKGTLSVQFKMIGGASDQNAGIAFDISPDGEYLYARYNTKDGDLALWRFAKGERQLIVHGTGARQLPLNAWHELVVTIRDRTISASIAGDTTLALTHTLDAVPSGRVGVWVKRDAVTAFRQFTLKPTL